MSNVPDDADAPEPTLHDIQCFHPFDPDAVQESAALLAGAAVNADFISPADARDRCALGDLVVDAFVREEGLSLAEAGGVPVSAAIAWLSRPKPEVSEPFIPNPFQIGILRALDGKALRTDPLADEVGDRRKLFRDPGGLKELQRHRKVSHHSRVGYYRPDCPPPEFAEQLHQDRPK